MCLKGRRVQKVQKKIRKCRKMLKGDVFERKRVQKVQTKSSEKKFRQYVFERKEVQKVQEKKFRKFRKIVQKVVGEKKSFLFNKAKTE